VATQNRIAHEINEAPVGTEFEVLVEGPDDKSPRKVRGRTRQNKLVIFEGEAGLTGAFVVVEAKEARLWGWLGTAISGSEFRVSGKACGSVVHSEPETRNPKLGTRRNGGDRHDLA
jgi:hypothetical protein